MFLKNNFLRILLNLKINGNIFVKIINVVKINV